ncbi:DUF881 domain-containing protein [Kitasatospora sp. NBC_01539]|uniref:DUF881 domain-containing protein n=1 Tax=Kitasatospora sp. NBC_01539 TaxID=2903577 RepID=UPI0038601900
MEQDDRAAGRPEPQEPLGGPADLPAPMPMPMPMGEEPAEAPRPGLPGMPPPPDEPRDPAGTAGHGAAEDGAADPGTEPVGAVDGGAVGGGAAVDGATSVETVRADDGFDARRRLRAALWPLRVSRGQLVVAVLLFALGLGLAIQVRSTNDHNQLRGARQEDLVRILDELDSRQQRLQQEKTQLEQSLIQLENSSNQAREAKEQTLRKVAELGVLAGTEQATGPGIILTINDPQGQVKADMLLDTLQELRAAGAEAIQINDVRVVAGTYFTDGTVSGVQIDGKDIAQPFRFTVVGNPQDLTPALNIPGGVVRTLEKQQATAVITQQQKVVVDALASPAPLQYGKPAAK